PEASASLPAPAPSATTPEPAPTEQKTVAADVVVPELGGTLSQAVALLQAQGLTLGDVVPSESPLPADRVLGQEPAAGTSIAPGGVMHVVVASGTNTVPDVAGLGLDDAQRSLEEAGFRVVRPDDADASARVTGTRP